EAEDVSVTRIAGGDPYALVAGHRSNQWQQVLRQAEDPGPAVCHLRQLAEQLDEKRVESLLDRLGRGLVVRHLGEDREVAKAAEDDAPIRKLLPVVEAVPGVVGAVEQALG